MSRLSAHEVDTLRSWFLLTKAIYSASQVHMRTPTKPLGWMVLAYLATRVDGAASYAELRAACDVAVASSITQLVGRLVKAGYATRTRRGRECHLTLDEPGWNVVGKIAQARTATL
jgi:hypothetical protein